MSKSFLLGKAAARCDHIEKFVLRCVGRDVCGFIHRAQPPCGPKRAIQCWHELDCHTRARSRERL